MLTGVGMIDFPGSMAALPYQEHTTYLSCRPARNQGAL